MRAQFILSEVGIGLRRNVTMTVAAVMNIMISLVLLGGALMIRGGVDRLQHELLNSLEVSVYLQPTCGSPHAPSDCLTATSRSSILTTLQGLPQVDEITYISPSSAYERFKEQFADDPDLIKATPHNALPASFAVKLKNPRQFEVVNSAVSRLPGVSSVGAPSGALHSLFNFFHWLTVGALAMALLLLASTCLLIYNTMRVAAFSRRRETGIMRLVGASDFSIQAPFILEGTVSGVLGSGLAVLFLGLVRMLISHTISSTSPVLNPFGAVGTYLDVVPVVVVVGVGLSAIASFITLQRHLRV